MRILVTGCNGFLGYQVMNYLTLMNYKVTGLSRTNNNLNCITCDLSKPIENNSRFDVIIHLAATLPKNGSSLNEMIENNIIATKNLVEYAERVGVEKFIFTSSISVYGNVKGSIITQNTQIIDPSEYGMTKLICERILENSKIPSKITIRIPGILGADAENVWIAFVANQLKTNNALTVFNSDSLYNNSVFTEKICEFIHRLIEMKWDSYRCVNIASEEPISVKEIIRLISDYYKSTSEIFFVEDKSKPCFVISIDYAKQLGFIPESVTETILKFLDSN